MQSDLTNLPLAVRATALTHAYGRRTVLQGLDLSVPAGAMYALLGENGAGKSTLLRLIAGIEPVRHGTLELFGVSGRSLAMAQRQRLAYVAEGQQLPGWMRLSQLEGYCAPLYPTWDAALATRLRDRFALDPMQRVSQMSRGQRMKAALLCALAPRPALLLMDEPFTGIDVATKDDLVRGLLDTATGEGCTVLVCTHDIAEIELLADWVGFLRDGRIEVSAPLESLREGYKRVELTLAAQATVPTRWPSSWLQVQQAGHRVSALMPHEDAHGAARGLPRLAAQVDVHEVTLKELYLALGTTRREVAA